MLAYSYSIFGKKHVVKGDPDSLTAFKALLDRFGTGSGEGLGFSHMGSGQIEKIPEKRNTGNRTMQKKDLVIRCIANDSTTQPVELAVELVPAS